MNPAEKRPSSRAALNASVVLFAALYLTGCSTIVNQGRHSNSGGTGMEKHVDPWVWGNAVFAVFPPVAIAGLGIDACSGNWYRYEKRKSPPVTPDTEDNRPGAGGTAGTEGAEDNRPGAGTEPPENPYSSLLKP